MELILEEAAHQTFLLLDLEVEEAVHLVPVMKKATHLALLQMAFGLEVSLGQ